VTLASGGRAPRRGPARRLGALLVIVAFAAAACLDAPQASVGPTPTREPEATPTVTTFELGSTVWYEGLLVHLDRATAQLGPRAGVVDVVVRLENPGPEESELNGAIRLATGGATIDAKESRIPPVPPDGVGGAVLTYELTGVSSVADGVLEIGDDPQHIATVPLVQPPEPVTFEPVQMDLAGTGTAGDLKLALHHGELRWDLPDWSQQLVAGLQALTLTYDASYLGSFAGGFAFTGDNVALRLPDGKVVGARRDGHSQSVELIGARKTKKNLFSRFEIPSGMTGRFNLLVKNGSNQVGIPFTIEG